MRLCRNWVWIALVVGLAGCSRSPAPTTDTGARTALQQYGEAIVHRDWKKAYAILHPDSRRHRNVEQFSRAAAAYRHRFGFEPEQFRIRSCEEQGTQAVTHFVFTGHSPSRHQRYNDGVVLRQSGDGWRVVLPLNFGR